MSPSPPQQSGLQLSEQCPPTAPLYGPLPPASAHAVSSRGTRELTSPSLGFHPVGADPCPRAAVRTEPGIACGRGRGRVDAGRAGGRRARGPSLKARLRRPPGGAGPPRRRTRSSVASGLRPPPSGRGARAHSDPAPQGLLGRATRGCGEREPERRRRGFFEDVAAGEFPARRDPAPAPTGPVSLRPEPRGHPRAARSWAASGTVRALGGGRPSPLSESRFFAVETPRPCWGGAGFHRRAHRRTAPRHTPDAAHLLAGRLAACPRNSP